MSRRAGPSWRSVSTRSAGSSKVWEKISRPQPQSTDAAVLGEAAPTWPCACVWNRCSLCASAFPFLAITLDPMTLHPHFQKADLPELGAAQRRDVAGRVGEQRVEIVVAEDRPLLRHARCQ